MHKEEPDNAPKASRRVELIDALRGFDMFWILGGDQLMASLRSVSDSSAVVVLADQLDHVEWVGFHFYDLIFPLFVFLMGTSTVFSLTKIVEQQGKAAAYWRILRRGVLLYVLGLFYYGGLSRDGGPEMFRYVGVLQRIAICYVGGGVLFINLRFRGLMVACVLLLAGYWALLTFIPVPGATAADAATGRYAEGTNLTNYIDSQFLPGYKWDGDWDPEGLLSNLPAIASGLLGIFAGMLIRRQDISDRQRLAYLTAAGLVCLGLGWLWGLQFPIVKKLWTSSYVLFAAGWSYLLVALFYLVIDVWRIRLWSRPFVWIGMNCIAVYVVNNLVGGFDGLVRRVLHKPFLEAAAPWGDPIVSVLGLALAIAFCHFLYRRRVFIRV